MREERREKERKGGGGREGRWRRRKNRCNEREREREKEKSFRVHARSIFVVIVIAVVESCCYHCTAWLVSPKGRTCPFLRLALRIRYLPRSFVRSFDTPCGSNFFHLFRPLISLGTSLVPSLSFLSPWSSSIRKRANGSNAVFSWSLLPLPFSCSPLLLLLVLLLIDSPARLPGGKSKRACRGRRRLVERNGVRESERRR